VCRIFERDGRRVLFIHIPKTGGTSIIDMLVRNGWETAQEIPKASQSLRDEFPRLINSKHQHEILRKSWNLKWDYEFALVRNPYSRAFSQAKHVAKTMDTLQDIDPRYPKTYGFGLFMHKVITETIASQGISVDDNHFRPQVDFISKKTEWFRIEDQKDYLLNSLKSLDIISVNSELDNLNFSFSENQKDPDREWMQVKNVHKKFIDIYSKDFKKFGYKI
jgi:hypothetical protein